MDLRGRVEVSFQDTTTPSPTTRPVPRDSCRWRPPDRQLNQKSVYDSQFKISGVDLYTGVK